MSIEPLSQSMEFAVLPKLGPTQNKYVWEENVDLPYSHKLTWCDSILSRTSWGCNDFHSNSTAVCDNRQSIYHSAVWEPGPQGIALFQETIQIFECMNPLRTIPSTWFHISGLGQNNFKTVFHVTMSFHFESSFLFILWLPLVLLWLWFWKVVVWIPGLIWHSLTRLWKLNWHTKTQRSRINFQFCTDLGP
jgi:hypothetical protein